MANWKLKDIQGDNGKVVCMHCGETFGTSDECPRWDSNGFEVHNENEDFDVRLCRDCADRHFYPELYNKPVAPATGINNPFIAEHGMEKDLAEIRKTVMQQALQAYDEALDIWEEHSRASVDDEVWERGVRAFIRMNELMGQMRSKKNLAILHELHYNISWEYMHHPLFIEWESKGRR